MKVRDVVKRLEQDGWRLARIKAVTGSFTILPSRVQLPSRDIRHWTFRREH